MKYNELTLSKRRAHSRVGRGIAAGQGKTAGRGTKGQGARAGSSRRPGFSGGQTPLIQQLPKLRGFKAVKNKAEIVYTSQLNQFKGAVSSQTLADAHIITTAHGRAKVIVRGNVTAKVEVKLQGASLKAIEMIQKAGGSFETVDRQNRPATSTKKVSKNK